MDEKRREKDWFKINIFMAETFVTLGMVFLAVTVLNSINLWSAVIVFGILAFICMWFAKISIRTEKSKFSIRKQFMKQYLDSRENNEDS